VISDYKFSSLYSVKYQPVEHNLYFKCVNHDMFVIKGVNHDMFVIKGVNHDMFVIKGVNHD
jgi:hypothetical protein